MRKKIYYNDPFKFESMNGKTIEPEILCNIMFEKWTEKLLDIEYRIIMMLYHGYKKNEIIRILKLKRWQYRKYKSELKHSYKDFMSSSK